MSSFDPDAAARPDSGIFGLSSGLDEARVILVPVPFDATTSYRRGAAEGPQWILEASHQVDLFDLEVGRPYVHGIHQLDEPAQVVAWNREAREAADPIIEAAGVIEGNPALALSLALVNERSAQVNEHVYQTVAGLLARGKLVGLVGGDHATPYGSIRAHAERHPGLGVLHIDAHADLRDSFEGFTWSHASIMHNVATRLDQVSRIVQVGVRDFGEAEHQMIERSGGRIRTFFDLELAREKIEGTSFRTLAERIVEELPREVYVSFDIDGLDPSLCPGTGTPVPGGLSFHEASYLLGTVVRSGRTIVGFDLNEVAPGPVPDEWNGNVGARLLYKMIGWALLSSR
jgi:agmatinase